MNFKDWISAKKVKSHDLVFVQALKQPEQIELFNQIANQMAMRGPSFTEGLAFLEMSLDLILMGHFEDLLPATDANFETWLGHLKTLRYPQTHLQDQATQNAFEKLPWPQGSKIKFERRGDKSGVELKYFITNKSDLIKLIASLERVQNEISP